MSITFDEFVSRLGYIPTEEQQAVIRSNERATLVIAGAGSGKTATMAQRIAWKIVSGEVEPAKVLGLTFTRKAAGELAERVNKQIAVFRTEATPRFDDEVTASESAEADDLADSIHAASQRPEISTYNSFAASIASAYAMLIGEDPRARLITEAERWQMMNEVVQNLPEDFAEPVSDSATSVAGDALKISDAMIDNGLDIATVREWLSKEHDDAQQLISPRVLAKLKPQDETSLERYNRGSATFKPEILNKLRAKSGLLAVVERYWALKKERSVIEFADQVARATRILREVPEVGEELRRNYSMVLLDEYQDTSVSQAELLYEAFGRSPSVTAVGDPNQSIYGWRGASANALSDFAESFLVTAEGQLTLSVAFRNSSGILEAANLLTQGKLTYDSLNVKPLQPASGKGSGRTLHIHRHRKEDAYATLAKQLKAELAREIPTTDSSGNKTMRAPEIAVLIRNNNYVESLRKALEAENIPFEVIGGESIILKPEILTLRAVLSVIAFPDRNDRVLHFLNYLGVGPADIAGFASFAYAVADHHERPEGQRPDPNLAEALAALEDPNADFTALAMTDEGKARCREAMLILRTLREQRHLPVPDLVSLAISLLNFDVYAATRLVGGSRLHAAFGYIVRSAAQYVGEHPGASLGDFLNWIDALEARERGGEDETSEDVIVATDVDIEPQAGVVQILTIHAAKGLEWDVVAIPEMIHNRLDYSVRILERWHSSVATFPYPLRKDARHLPTFSAQGFTFRAEDPRETKIEFLRAYGEHLEELEKHVGDESRRLAYVAVTRPRDTLILMSYDVRDDEQAYKIYANVTKNADIEGMLHSDLRGNVFLKDVDSILEVDDGGEPAFKTNEEFAAWAKEEDIPNLAEPALSLAPTEDDIVWPGHVDRSLDHGAQLPQVSTDSFSTRAQERVSFWREAAEQLAAEEREKKQETTYRRDYLTASDIVNFVNDEAAFDLEQRRPIPTQPSLAARRGTAVHEQIAHAYNSPQTLEFNEAWEDGLLDPEEYSSVGQGLETDAHAQASIEEVLLERFYESRFSQLPAVAIEKPVELELGGVPVRCVIDAVLDSSELAELAPLMIVDWKTGRRPSQAQIASRQFQLGLYRVAWSRLTGIPIADIGACFYYLGEAEPQARELHAGDLSEAEVEEIVTRATK